MKREISYKNLDMILGLLTKIATRDVHSRWEIAKRKRVVKSAMEPVDEAREVPEEMKKYSERQMEIYNKYGTLIGGTGEHSSFRFDQDSADIVKKKTKELKDEFSDTLEAEKKRIKDVESLLDTKVEIDLDPIDYEWVGDFLDSNDVELLMEVDMINEPKDEEDEEEDDKKPKGKKKRSRK